MAVSTTEAANITLLPDQCEIDRYCCVTQGINKICQRSDSNSNFSNPFQWKDLQLQDINEAGIWHYPGSFYANANKDGYPAKGGIGRVQIGPYGWVFSGPNIDSGNINRFVWTPTKVMEFGETWSGLSSQYESEVTSDRYSVVSKLFAKARATGNLSLSIMSLKGGQGTQWRTDINGTYCGIQEKYILSAVGYPIFEKDMLFVMNPCPTSYDLKSRKFYYSMTNGEIKEITILITDKDHESNVNDWMINYYSKEKAIRLDYENWARSISYPTGATQDEKKAYYLTDYSSWFNRMSTFNDTNSGNFKEKEIMTPNFIEYFGMWEHDSYWMALGDLQIATNNVRRKKIEDAIFVWKSAPPNTITIYQNSYNYKDEGYQGGWALTSWELYKQTGNKTFLCDSESWLKNQYETQTTKCPGFFCLGANLGRDGTNADSKIAMTNWYLLNSIVMSNIEKECGNSALSNQYKQNFENIKTELNKNWKPNLNFYSTRTDYIDTNALTCWSLGLDAIPEDNIQAYVDTLLTKFVDVVGLTSISTDHPCYTATGTENSCTGGEKWDGPVWAGIDNSICIWALRQQVNAYGRTQLSDELDKLIQISKKVAQQTKFGAESYSATGVGVGSWGSRPYAWGNLVGTVPISKKTPLSTLNLGSQLVCVPQTEVCDNIDNNCNGLIDENVSIQCMDYSSCSVINICGTSCQQSPKEICDGKDNNCDGTTDEGCLCIDSQTKQCGTTDIGECSYGSQLCSNGVWQECIGNVEPSLEIDDDKDNDCDDQIDEGFESDLCSAIQNQECFMNKSTNWLIDYLIWILQILKQKL